MSTSHKKIALLSRRQILEKGKELATAHFDEWNEGKYTNAEWDKILTNEAMNQGLGKTDAVEVADEAMLYLGVNVETVRMMRSEQQKSGSEDVEIPCDACDGTGWDQDSDIEIECSRCDGTGWKYMGGSDLNKASSKKAAIDPRKLPQHACENCGKPVAFHPELEAWMHLSIKDSNKCPKAQGPTQKQGKVALDALNQAINDGGAVDPRTDKEYDHPWDQKGTEPYTHGTELGNVKISDNVETFAPGSKKKLRDFERMPERFKEIKNFNRKRRERPAAPRTASSMDEIVEAGWKKTTHAPGYSRYINPTLPNLVLEVNGYGFTLFTEDAEKGHVPLEHGDLSELDGFLMGLSGTGKHAAEKEAAPKTEYLLNGKPVEVLDKSGALWRVYYKDETPDDSFSVLGTKLHIKPAVSVKPTKKVPQADDMCNACGKNVATRECGHGILCDKCDKDVHGKKGGPCKIGSTKQADVKMHESPRVLPPRDDLRRHVDEDLKKELKKDLHQDDEKTAAPAAPEHNKLKRSPTTPAMIEDIKEPKKPSSYAYDPRMLNQTAPVAETPGGAPSWVTGSVLAKLKVARPDVRAIIDEMIHCPTCKACINNAAIMRLVEHLKTEHNLGEFAQTVSEEVFKMIHEGRKQPEQLTASLKFGGMKIAEFSQLWNNSTPRGRCKLLGMNGKPTTVLFFKPWEELTEMEKGLLANWLRIQKLNPAKAATEGDEYWLDQVAEAEEEAKALFMKDPNMVDLARMDGIDMETLWQQEKEAYLNLIYDPKP